MVAIGDLVEPTRLREFLAGHLGAEPDAFGVERHDQGFSNQRFYRVLAVYRMAALGEMCYARYLMGNSDSRFYAMMADGVPAPTEQGTAIIEGEQPL